MWAYRRADKSCELTEGHINNASLQKGDKSCELTYNFFYKLKLNIMSSQYLNTCIKTVKNTNESMLHEIHTNDLKYFFVVLLLARD